MNDAASTSIVHDAISHLQQLSELFQKRREQLARSAGITVQEWRVMEEIYGENFMPSLFARERESSRAAVSKILRQLIEKGLIAVAISPDNGRHRDYSLTEEGRTVIAALRRARQEAIDNVWSSIPEEELARFVAFSHTLTTKLEHYAKREE